MGGEEEEETPPPPMKLKDDDEEEEVGAAGKSSIRFTGGEAFGTGDVTYTPFEKASVVKSRSDSGDDDDDGAAAVVRPFEEGESGVGR